MLSDTIWRTKFGADPHIVGRALDFDGGQKTVVGILPASFDFSTIFTPGSRVDIFECFPLTPETNKWGNTLAIVGRLKPGVGVQQAQAESTVLAKLQTEAHKERNSFDPKVSMLTQHVSGRLRPALFVLAAAVGVVMLIVCANLSNLLLARGTTRQKEIAIRATLGAGKMRLVRQMLTESLILSFCGAIVGLILALIGTRVLARLTWLDSLGREGILAAEGGVLTVGLANDMSASGKSLTQIATVAGVSLTVPIANRALAAETSVNLHAWIELEPSRAFGQGNGDAWAFVFGPSITVGNLGADL